VQNAFEHVQATARIVQTPAEIDEADKLVLPGVGAFGEAAGALRERGMVGPILDFVARGRPFLGICLGLQLLFDVSYEQGEHTGLGLIRGKVVPFDFERAPARSKLKVPHMGWNRIYWDKPVTLLNGLDSGCYVYFAHSFHVVPLDKTVGTGFCDYGGRFTCMVWRDNLFATQFHPEKSQAVGLKILENFARL